HNMEHLRILGSVGEPIAAEVWKWYYEVVGKSKCQVIDVCFLSPFFRSVTRANVSTDLLANRDGFAHYHPAGWCDTHEARQCHPAVPRHRARHHRPCLRPGAAG